MFNLAPTFDTNAGLVYAQTGFDVIIDKKCWAITNSVENGFALDKVSTASSGDIYSCSGWRTPNMNDDLDVFPEYKTSYYFARGTSPFPLIGAKDYGQFSQVLLSKKTFLLENP